MAKNETAAAPAKTAPEAVYTREQVMSSQRYANRRDLVSVLLESGKTYTLDEVDALINTPPCLALISSKRPSCSLKRKRRKAPGGKCLYLARKGPHKGRQGREG